jgi:hypothetical protein
LGEAQRQSREGSARNNARGRVLFVEVHRGSRSKISNNERTFEAAMNESTNRSHRQQMGFERAQEARRALKVSPVERNRQKVREALLWLHVWQQSTAEIVRKACRSSSTSFLAGMREAGLARTERVLGRTFWLLTKTGVDTLRSLLGEDHEGAKLAGTRSANLYAFAHNMHAQTVLAEKLRRGGDGCRWWGDRQLRALAMSEQAAKCPDAAFRAADGSMTYIEVERSKKKTPELETMLLALARLIEGKPRAQVEIHIEEGISERYVSTLKGWIATGSFRAWSLGTDGELFQQGIYRLTDSLRDAMRRIEFITCKISA